MQYSIATVWQRISTICLVALAICHLNVFAVNASKRIIGGTVITIDKAPYLVQLRSKDGQFFCGGTLISPKYVLTAAHCFEKRDFKDVKVIGGASTLSDKGVVQGNIASMYKHPEYNPQDFHTDIAVLTLAEEMKGENIESVPLCQQPLKEGDLVQVSGWGHTSKHGSVSQQLRTIRVPVRSRATCVNEFKRFVQKNMFCASGLEAKGICMGDSGGPAIFKGQLCGVVSFMYKCGEIGSTSAFTDVYSVFAAKEQPEDKLYFLKK